MVVAYSSRHADGLKKSLCSWGHFVIVRQCVFFHDRSDRKSPIERVSEPLAE